MFIDSGIIVGANCDKPPLIKTRKERKIKEAMKRHFNIIKIPILYGGSVNAANSADIFSLKNVDGGLIGGASLIASEFCKIYDTL